MNTSANNRNPSWKELRAECIHIHREAEARLPEDAGLPSPSRSTGPNPSLWLFLTQRFSLSLSLFNDIPFGQQRKTIEKENQESQTGREISVDTKMTDPNPGTLFINQFLLN